LQVVQDNGFRPVWNRTMTFEIAMPELACICFTVFDEDMFGDSAAIGQASKSVSWPHSLVVTVHLPLLFSLFYQFGQRPCT
jgi:hypothetical protein